MDATATTARTTITYRAIGERVMVDGQPATVVGECMWTWDDGSRTVLVDGATERTVWDARFMRDMPATTAPIAREVRDLRAEDVIVGDVVSIDGDPAFRVDTVRRDLQMVVLITRDDEGAIVGMRRVTDLRPVTVVR